METDNSDTEEEITFKCRFCSRIRPESLKSKEKEGWCRLCTGEIPE